MGLPLRALAAEEKEIEAVKENTPVISVIIPTHNREVDLRRTLEALKAQTYPLPLVEVIAVADGCTDGTLDMLNGYRAPFALRFIAQSNLGPGAARNLGAASAPASLLLFLDDDVEPAPSFIEAHVLAHQRQKGHVVIGPYLPFYQHPTFYQIRLRAWWEKVFNEMLQPGHRFTFCDLLTGNMSMESEIFTRIGDFHTAMRAHEDYEYGMRLIKAGVPFAVAPDATGRHHDQSDLRRAFRRKREEGRSDVIMARLHPEFIQALPLAGPEVEWLSPTNILRFLAFHLPTLGDAFAAVSRRALDSLEKIRLRIHWGRLFGAVLTYWYWRGAASELGTIQKLKDLISKSTVRFQKNGPKAEIDLSEGLEAAEQRLDEERPLAARVRFGQRPIGNIYPQPGAEALRGIHLRYILANSLSLPLLQALALEGGITDSRTVDRLKLSRTIRERSHWFGPIRPGQMWWEQYSQWNELEKKDSDKNRKMKDHWDRLNSLEQEVAWLEEQRLLGASFDQPDSKKNGFPCEKGDFTNRWFEKKAWAMNRLILQVLVDCLALWVAIQLVPGIHSPDGFVAMFLTLALFGFINVFIRPSFVFLTFPLILITVGPLLLLLNASLILICSLLARIFGLGFTVDGWMSAMVGAVTVSAVRMMILGFTDIGKRTLVYRKEQAWSKRLEKRKILLEGQIADLQWIAKDRKHLIQEPQANIGDRRKNGTISQRTVEEG